MFGRLREIDGELADLPEQLVPLEKQVQRGREVLSQSEQNNPMRLSLSALLKNAERVHVENLGWLVSEQTTDPAAVTMHVARYMSAAVGRPHYGGDLAPYESSLAEFIRVPGGPAMPAGTLEGALLRKLFGDSWLGADAKTRAHVMAVLKQESELNERWLPEPKAQVFDEEGRGVVSEGAGAFGAYFSAAALVTIGLHSLQLSLPTRTFAAIGGTMSQLVDDDHFQKFSRGYALAASTLERGRTLVVVAYVHFIRAILMGNFEREHRKIMDVLGDAEVMLEAGKKRVERLQTIRSEMVMQLAGTIGLLVTTLGALGFVGYSLLVSEQPLKTTEEPLPAAVPAPTTE